MADEMAVDLIDYESPIIQVDIVDGGTSSGSGLPAGGDAWQVLGKDSSVDNDVSWQDLQAIHTIVDEAALSAINIAFDGIENQEQYNELLAMGFTYISSAIGALNLTANIRSINKAGHGLSVGNIVRLEGGSESGAGTYVLSQADSELHAQVDGMVIEVTDANNFKLWMGGYADGLASLAPAALFYLHPTVAGALTTTKPTTPGQVVKPLFRSIGTTRGQFSLLNYSYVIPAPLTTADVAPSSNRRYVSDAELAVLQATSGVNTGDQDLTDYFDKTADDLDDITQGSTNKHFTLTEKNKLAAIEALAEVNNISDVDANDLTDGGQSALHYHSSDRARANHTGTQTASTISDFDTAADARITAQKGAANGIAPLDGSSKIPSTYLPAYVDDVLEYANLAAFPVTGTAGIIYVALDTNKVYRWSGSAYTEISPSPGSTDAVPEGSSNLYYTNARADARIASAIGVTVQGLNANLTALAGLTGLADRLPYFTAAGTMALATYTAYGRSLTAAVDAAATRTLLGLVIGTDVQAFNANLAAIAALSPSNDDILQRKAGAWTNRTPAQFKTDLALVKGDVGLGNVDNTSDATKNSATATLTNKRFTSRVLSITSSATPSINTDNYDAVSITALAANITSMTTNLTGTPNNFDRLLMRIKDDGTPRTITWGASFVSSGIATLLATTAANKTHLIGFLYNSVTGKWVCQAVDATGY